MKEMNANKEKGSVLPAENAVLESISDGVIVGDVSGKVAFLNQAAAQTLGVDSPFVLGQPVRALFEPFPAGEPGAVVDAMDRLYADPYTYGQDTECSEVTFALEERTIWARLSPVLTSVGEFLGVSIVLRDVTSKVETERARSMLLRAVSHELRAPLTAIKGYSEMLMNNVAKHLDQQQMGFLRIIRRNADRLVAMVSDLLDVSHIDNGQLKLDMQPVQLETVIREVADDIQSHCDRKGLHLTIEVEPDVGTVSGDKDRLVQIVSNMARNACRCTPEGGYIMLTVSRSGDTVRVDVADTGVGIKPEDRDKMFQGFHKPDIPGTSELGGTGLEMAIARMLVEMHGGTMWAESQSGHGTVFSFALPISIDTDAAQAIGGPELLEPGRTVLVVEDDPDVAQLIELKLREQGLDVIATEQGEEALELARTKEIDLITLDMMLPDITGMDVLRRLREDRETSDIPVIIVSVLKPDQTGDGTGVVDHITKPFTLDRLMGSIRRALVAA
jgi:PAS domain S-box-containing protein